MIKRLPSALAASAIESSVTDTFRGSSKRSSCDLLVRSCLAIVCFVFCCACMACSSCYASTRLMATASTSSRIPSSSRKLSNVEPLWFVRSPNGLHTGIPMGQPNSTVFTDSLAKPGALPKSDSVRSRNPLLKGGKVLTADEPQAITNAHEDGKKVAASLQQFRQGALYYCGKLRRASKFAQRGSEWRMSNAGKRMQAISSESASATAFSRY